MVRPASDPFQPDGGMKLLTGNLGRCIMKTSAVDPSHWTIEAPVRVFSTQEGVIEAFKKGELDRDVIVVVRFQGPRANGMPELHKLTPQLGVLQDKGYRVALLTDGRMRSEEHTSELQSLMRISYAVFCLKKKKKQKKI